MTPAGPLGGAVPAGGAHSGATAGVAGATGAAGGDFLALVLQILGQPPAPVPGTAEETPAGATPVGATPASETPASETPASETPAGGASATVPAAGKVAGSPLPGDPSTRADDQDDVTPDAPAAADPGTLGVLPVALVQAVLASAGTGAGTTDATTDAQPGTPAAGGVGRADHPKGHPAAADPTPDRGPTPVAAGPAAAASPARAAGDQPAPDPTPSTPTPATSPATSPAGSSTAVGAPAPAAPVAATAPATRPDAPAPVTHQVLDEIVRVAGTGDGTRRVTVRLQPEALGEVRVVLSMRDGALRVSLSAAGPAHHTLLEGAPELQRLLQAVGSPDARIIVRDLPGAAPTSPAPASATSTGTGAGAGTSQDLGPGPGAGQPDTGQPDTGQPDTGRAGGQTPDRRTPSHRPSTAMDGIHDPADPPRRTESVTRTRPAGVDVTM